MHISSRQQKFINALPDSWKEPLMNFCTTSSMEKLLLFLKEREEAGARIYPSKKDLLAAFKITSFDDVSVIIVGQDPYHGPGQAHGLSFSVPSGVPLPPSLRNIFKELQDDSGVSLPAQGTLTGWAAQGVLLLNSLLTVEEHRPASHAHRGWEEFTDGVLKHLIQRNKPLVMMLWGAYAKKKITHFHQYINPRNQLLLYAAHPSPLSIKGFLGCKHFSQANRFLHEQGLPTIRWDITV